MGMAITKKQWEGMIPGKVKIVDGRGYEWFVVGKLTDGKYPVFLLQIGKRKPIKRMFVPNAIYDEPGIVDQAWNWVSGLNLPTAKIVKIRK